MILLRERHMTDRPRHCCLPSGRESDEGLAGQTMLEETPRRKGVQRGHSFSAGCRPHTGSQNRSLPDPSDCKGGTTLQPC